MEKPAQFLTPQFFITVLMLGLVGYVLFEVFKGTPPASNDVQVMVITAVVIAGLQEIRKYWLNSTSESEKKNETIANLSSNSGTGPGTSGAAANQALANVVARDTAASPTPLPAIAEGQTQKVEITGVSAEAVADAEKLIAKDR